MSFPPFTASHNEPAIPCTASQKTSHCCSHSVQLPSCCSLTAYLLHTTINRLPFAPSSQRPDLSLLSKLHTIPPHPLTHAVNLPHLPSRCFKTCYFCTYGETTDLYVLPLPSQLPFLPPKSHRKDLLSLIHRIGLLLHQARTHSHLVLQPRKTGAESKFLIHRNDTTKTSCILLPSSDF